MKKRFFFYTLLLLVFCISCSTRIIRPAHQGEKADFGITAPGKAVFFVENEGLESTDEQIKLHTQTADRMYNKFGLSTDRLMIGRTNAQTFKFSVGIKTWFVVVKNLKKRTAMILFDGANKPIIEYNPEQYNDLVLHYLADDLKRSQESRKNNLMVKKNTAAVLDSLWAIPFSPDKTYADKIINLSQTSYYPGLFRGKCQGEIESTSYNDAAQKEVTSIYSTTYDKGRIMKSENSRDGNSFQHQYFVNRLGLIDSAISTLNNKTENAVYFKYLKDRYITRGLFNKERDEYLLNNKQQVSKKISFDEGNQIKSEQRYFYDPLGRLSREESYSAGENTLTSTYEYANANQKTFTKMTVFDAEGNILSESTSTNNKGTQTFITKIKGKIHSKNITELDETCQGKTTVFNNENEITQLIVQVRKD